MSDEKDPHVSTDHSPEAHARIYAWLEEHRFVPCLGACKVVFDQDDEDFAMHVWEDSIQGVIKAKCMECIAEEGH